MPLFPLYTRQRNEIDLCHLVLRFIKDELKATESLDEIVAIKRIVSVRLDKKHFANTILEWTFAWQHRKYLVALTDRNWTIRPYRKPYKEQRHDHQ